MIIAKDDASYPTKREEVIRKNSMAVQNFIPPKFNFFSNYLIIFQGLVEGRKMIN